MKRRKDGMEREGKEKREEWTEKKREKRRRKWVEIEVVMEEGGMGRWDEGEKERWNGK